MADLPLRRTCGANDVHEAMMANADYRAARAAITERTMLMAAEGPPDANQLRIIPTVVHVIHRSSPENISDAQIKSQIAVLNRDFRMTNADVGKVPAVFKPVVADAFVEFALATKDPLGQATTGVTRTQTTVAQFTTNNAMKFTQQGGHDAWDAARYLNIWVCPEIFDGPNALLGYAQFPGGLPATDGVAIANNAFGTTGTAQTPFNLGRTATHEIGHWLDLFHIWGDRVDCTTDDLVADTPIQQRQNFNKPTHPHPSCTPADMFMNYMDYVDDDTMYMFTAGQVARIRATLAGPRATVK